MDVEKHHLALTSCVGNRNLQKRHASKNICSSRSVTFALIPAHCQTGQGNFRDLLVEVVVATVEHGVVNKAVGHHIKTLSRSTGSHNFSDFRLNDSMSRDTTLCLGTTFDDCLDWAHTCPRIWLLCACFRTQDPLANLATCCHARSTCLGGSPCDNFRCNCNLLFGCHFQTQFTKARLPARLLSTLPRALVFLPHLPADSLKQTEQLHGVFEYLPLDFTI